MVNDLQAQVNEQLDLLSVDEDNAEDDEDDEAPKKGKGKGKAKATGKKFINVVCCLC